MSRAGMAQAPGAANGLGDFGRSGRTSAVWRSLCTICRRAHASTARWFTARLPAATLVRYAVLAEARAAALVPLMYAAAPLALLWLLLGGRVAVARIDLLIVGTAGITCANHSGRWRHVALSVRAPRGGYRLVWLRPLATCRGRLATLQGLLWQIPRDRRRCPYRGGDAVHQK